MLGMIEEDDDDEGMQNAASRAAAQRFLIALGEYVKPAVFVLPSGHFRLVWQMKDGDVREQFAVSFTGTGRANVVYSDPDAIGPNTRRRMVAGGLVGLEIPESRLVTVLAESGHDDHVRKGTPPAR